MIPLGWTTGTAALPPGISAVSADGISVIGVRGPQAATPRGRLAAQVRLFDAGVDFMPIPPRSDLSMTAALGAARFQQASLLRALTTIEKRGQMSLAVSWQDVRTPCAPDADGRTWLRTRHGDLSRAKLLADEAQEFLGTLAQATGFPTTPIENRRCTAQACLLVPRQDVTTLKTTLATLARAITTLSLTLTISGPWPPSAFAPHFEITDGMAA